MNAQGKKVDVLALMQLAADMLDTGEFEVDRETGRQLEAAIPLVADLIYACRERDDANAAWNCLEGVHRQYPGPEYQRARAADKRYAAALASVGGAQS